MSHLFLTDEQIQRFVEDGYIILRGAFSPEVASQWVDVGFQRLGYNRHDPATWKQQRLIMPPSRTIEVAQFAPDVWKAACDLLGGAERIKQPYTWCDAFIMNLGWGADRPWEPPSPLSKGWHKDGDWFKHFLDTPEQALLPITCWTDMLHQGGGTFLAIDSVAVVARFMADHPEGVLPGEFNIPALIEQCHDFVEMTGSAGDVILHHPFMLHASSQNTLKVARAITNQSMHLLEPMNFNRPNPEDFSVVERATLHSLGVDRLDFHPTTPRQRVTPERERIQARMLEEERARAAAGVTSPY